LLFYRTKKGYDQPGASPVRAPPAATIIFGDEFMSSHFFHRAPVSRRRFLQKSAFAAGALTLPAAPFPARAATALKPVTFTLDWLYQGASVGFLLAKDKGYYSDAGLDVSISPGKGSGTTAQLVGSKATQIGFADGYVVGNSISKGMAIKTVASIYRRDPAALMVLADSPIKTPKDLEGKTLAMTAGSAQFQQWPAFTKGAGIDPAKVQIVNIDPAGVGPALVSGKADAIGGYVFSYAPSIQIRAKKELRIFWFADYGVTIVSNGVIVHQDLLKSDPDIIRAFVPATIKGFLYGRQHVDEAVATVKKYQPTADPAVTKLEFELAWKTWVSPNTKGKPLGWGSDADWAGTLAVLKQYGGVTAPLQTSQLYTNEFVPTGAEYVPPQET
jgi:NitT/TauT family transport system substrate-binding protein